MTLIDSTKLMYETFQSCRHALDNSEAMLDLLGTTLKAVEREGMFAVEMPADLVDSIDDHARQAIALPSSVDRESIGMLSGESQTLFSLICIAVPELKRLWPSNSILAVRSIGYALHSIPRMLETPEQFKPKDYLLCFRIVSAHWNELTPELQQMFCRAAGLAPEDAAQLISADEFPIRMWG